jgi:hydrogenase expression/formation protein HypC
MCLALPARVVSIDETTEMAMVELGGVQREASLALLEEVTVGDYVLLHVGYALNKVSTEEAERTLQLFAEAGLESGSGE